MQSNRYLNFNAGKREQLCVFETFSVRLSFLWLLFLPRSLFRQRNKLVFLSGHISPWPCAVLLKLLPRRHFFDAVLSADRRQWQRQQYNEIYATNQMFLFLHFYRPKRLSKNTTATHVGMERLLFQSFISPSSTGS